MDRRKFIKNAGKVLLVTSSISLTGIGVSSCSKNDDSDDFSMMDTMTTDTMTMDIMTTDTMMMAINT